MLKSPQIYPNISEEIIIFCHHNTSIYLISPVPVTVIRHSNIKKNTRNKYDLKHSMSMSLPFNLKRNDQKEALAHNRIVGRSTKNKKV
jgi:hypothetical protein